MVNAESFDPFDKLRAVSNVERQSARAVSQRVGNNGVYLIQHLPDAFSVENGKGKVLQTGKRSAGWVTAVWSSRDSDSGRPSWSRTDQPARGCSSRSQASSVARKAG